MPTEFDAMDVAELTGIIVQTHQDPRRQRDALSALARRERVERNSRLIVVMQYVLKYPDRYNLELMTRVIDILATDPHPDATTAMIELLPDIVTPVIDGTEGVSEGFRQYFYEALMTRQRDEDLEVWRDMLPALDPKTLVALIADPASDGRLDDLDPMTLVDRLEEPNRTKALIYVIASVAKTGASTTNIAQACERLMNSHSRVHLEQGCEVLRKQQKRARQAGDREQAQVLDVALAQIERA